MQRTISFMNGQGSIGHNSRAFIADNVKPDRTEYNESYFVEDIKEVYHHLFDEALNEYNAKQKRKDRQIKNYYEKIKRSKQEKLFYEVIVQIGNRDDTSVGSDAGEIAKDILRDYLYEFVKNNPNLYVFGAYIHMDEETPHMHIDFVPWVSGSKRGLETKNSLKGALAARGFKGEGKGYTEWQQWAEAEKEVLADVMLRHGIEWENKYTHEPHLSVLDYKKRKREKEIEICEGRLGELEEKLFEKESEIESARLLYEDEQQDAEESLRSRLALNAVKIENAENELKEIKEIILETRDIYEKEKSYMECKLKEVVKKKENELESVKKKLDETNEILEVAKLELKMAQSEVAEAKKLKAQLMYEMDGDDYLKEQVIELRYQNMVLKDENQTLKEKLNQAYEFMKQFVIEGMNMLEKFKLWIGEKVRDVWKR